MNTDTRLSLSAALAGILLFLVWGAILIFSEIPTGWIDPQDVGILFMTTVIFILPVGLLIGWVNNFPRWSYPFAGNTLLFSLYLMNVSTPGFIFGRELWGWRAWIPFLLIVLIAFAITRSFEPLKRFYSNMIKDWSVITYGMFGFMPLVVFIAFDEMERLYSLYFMIVLTILMCTTAFLYLYGKNRRQQITALVIGLILTIIVTILGPAFYWKETQWTGQVRVIMAGILIMLSPALIGILPKFLSRKAD